tara:strand:+ start:21708 stop:22904 length:1197 start_codon:yes stop_codon:yes gene_type:complete
MFSSKNIALVFFIFYSCILPLSYLIMGELDFFNLAWTTEYVSSNSKIIGAIYIFFSVFLIIYFHRYLFRIVAYKPRKHSNESLWNLLGLLGVFIQLFIIIYNSGRTASVINSENLRVVTFVGYFVQPLIIIGMGQFIYEIVIYNKLSKLQLLFISFFIINTVLIGNRSGIFEIIAITLFVLNIFQKTPIKLNFKVVFRALFFVLISFIIIEFAFIIRQNDELFILHDILWRFYMNIQVLFLAIEDHQAIYDILTYNQPRGLIENVFSFAVDRTHISSSFRLPNYWGGNIGVLDSGHIVGYAYGLHGLSYGLFKFFGGLAFIFIVFKTIGFFVKRICLNKRLYFWPIWIYFFSRIYYEFLMNLGLDSLVEKTSKFFFYCLLSCMVIILINLFFGKRMYR